MKTSQALLICGCFAEGIETAFDYGGKYYHLFVTEEVEGRFFNLDIHELEIRIPLDDYEEGKE